MTNNQREKAKSQSARTGTQAYILALFCLVLGVALGYLFRGSAPQVATAVAASNDSNAPQGRPTQPQLTTEQQKAMVDEAVAPCWQP